MSHALFRLCLYPCVGVLLALAALTFGDAVNFAQLKVEQELANLRRMFRQTQEHRQRSVSEQRKETEQLRRSVQRHKQDTAQLQFQARGTSKAGTCPVSDLTLQPAL